MKIQNFQNKRGKMREIPKELKESLVKWKSYRKYSAEKIRDNTDDWVEAQENIIRIKKSIALLCNKR